MVEQVALDALVLGPDNGVGKAVDLHRNAMRRRVHDAHHAQHVLADFRVVFQIAQHIGAEGAEVGQPAQVGRVAGGLLGQLLQPTLVLVGNRHFLFVQVAA